MFTSRFRHDFAGKEGKPDNTSVVIEPAGVTVWVSQKEDSQRRHEVLDTIGKLGKTLGKEINAHGVNGVTVKTAAFDLGLGLVFTSALESAKVVPEGSVAEVKSHLDSEGHLGEGLHAMEQGSMSSHGVAKGLRAAGPGKPSRQV